MHRSGQEDRQIEQGPDARRRVDGDLVRGPGIAIFVFVIITACSHALGAQLPEPPLPIDPRPLEQLISDAEKASLLRRVDELERKVEQLQKARGGDQIRQ